MSTEPIFRIRGLVVDPRTRRGIAGLRVEAWDKDLLVDDLVGSADTDAEGAFQIHFRPEHFRELFLDRSPDLYFKVFRGDRLVVSTERMVLWNQRAGETPVAIVVPVDASPEPPADRGVDGTIHFEHGLPAAGLVLRLYARGFGGHDARLAETVADVRGRYRLAYAAEDPVHLEVRAVDAAGTEVALSGVKFNAGAHEVLDLVAPAEVRPLEPEYTRLAADLAAQLGGRLEALAEAREDGGRQDLTLLHRSTGWDARLVAQAALAQRLAVETEVAPEALYALFRAGVPADAGELAALDAGTAAAALEEAEAAGIVGLGAEGRARALEAHARFAVRARLAVPAPGAVSTPGELLARSGLDEEEQAAFAALAFTPGADDESLWDRARAQGLAEEKVQALQLQGKLAFLTGDNAALAADLRQVVRSPDELGALADAELYRADAWKERLERLAGSPESRGAGVRALVPPSVPGESDAERLDAYAAELARKVRVSFPTRVVAQMLETGELALAPEREELSLGPAQGKRPIGREGRMKSAAPVAALLRAAEARGFVLGRTSADAFLREHGRALVTAAKVDPETYGEAVAGLGRLQRLYQATPTDHALGVLLEAGFDSALQVASFPPDVFMERYGARFASPHEARLVHRKAQQVSAVVRGVATAARELDSAPPVYAITGTPAAASEAKNALVKQFPTLETLFGAQDYCECEHCRSVLSPAAYLVDLLQLVDPEKQVWDSFLADWKAKHGGQAYTDRYRKAYDALVARRPDLPHLPLTCENTLTELPYIDVVNEILEYYVAHGKLDAQCVHDTGSATTDELLAEPQNVLAAAYDALKAARYPLALPFDLWIETVRRFSEQAETPLWQVLEIFRPSDDLLPPAPPAIAKAYYRVDVFGEQLGLAPAERALFTAANPLATWHELYGYPDAPTALDELKSARTLARRLGVSYRELVELVRTGFVNPRLDALVVLRKLGVEAIDVFRYQGHPDYPPFTAEEAQAFEARLDELTARFQSTGFDARTWLAKAWKERELEKVLVLAAPATGCDFGKTFLRYADGTAADGIVFLKLNLFVRLWRKLGWTMEETDRALQAFIPRDSLPLTGTTLGPALATALLSLAHLQALEPRVKVGKDARLRLLTLWSDLPTTGKRPLYARLFLSPTVLKGAPVFDDPLGLYLSKPGLLLKDQQQAVQGALGLNADDVARILAAAGKDLATAPLSIPILSLLYRHTLLARGLGLAVRELLALVALSGVDPFAPLAAAPVQALDDDHPFSRTLRFVEMAAEVRESGLGAEELEWLLRHHRDPVGKYRAAAAEPMALVKALASEVRRIRAEHAVPADPAALDDEQLRQKLALVLPAEGVQTLMGMWTGSVEHEASRPGVSAAGRLDPARLAKHPAVRVTYDAVRGVQRLAYRGVLLDPEKQAILTDAAYTAPAEAPLAALLVALLDEVQAAARADFQRQLEKAAGPGGRQVGFLDAADYGLLFLPAPAGLSEAQARQREEDRRGVLARAFFPFLQQQLVTRAVAQAVAADTGADPALLEGLLGDAALLADPSAPGRPLLEAFAAAGDAGVSAAWFASADLTGAPLASGTAPDAAYAGDPAGANSARFEGWLEVPTTGAYRFSVRLERAGAQAELRLEGLPRPVLQATAAAAGDEPGGFAELQAGVAYRFTLELRALGGQGAALRVQGETLAQGPLGQLAVYPAAAVERVRRARVLLGKVLQLVQALALTPRELRHLLTHRADFGGVDLGLLPTRPADDSPAAAQARFGEFLRLAGYARLKREVAGGTDDLVSVFEAARAVHPAAADPVQADAAVLAAAIRRLAEVLHRDEAAVRAAALHLGFTPTHAVAGGELRVEVAALAGEPGVRRLWELLQVVAGLGVPVEAAVRWATPRPDAAVARDLRDTLKARRDPEAWQRVARPIFDGLRQRQRDALVAHVMHALGFARLEQLFEYFLVDAGMEPVVRTSRLRLALASVQLFIQRCLLNLEPEVHPSALDGRRWQWMKRYRVWEANRKIFLFPENWLEPEFRDDRTDLYRELEGALLQGDVSAESAEDAFFRYLKRLEEMARLELVAAYLEEKPDPAANVLHVVGRTYAKPHRWFHRRWAHQAWTPWEPVTAEIEGDHVVAVVWRERLHLFWITFLEKAQEGTTAAKTPRAVADDQVSVTLKKEVEVQLNWSELFQGEWTQRVSSAVLRPYGAVVGAGFDRSAVFIDAVKEYEAGEERAVVVRLAGALEASFRVMSKNAPPEVGVDHAITASPYSVYGVRATLRPGVETLNVTFFQTLRTGPPPTSTPVTRQILRKTRRYTLLSYPGERPNAELAELTTPFFFQDDRHTFFVEPTLTETTVNGWRGWALAGASREARADRVRVGDLHLVAEVPASPLPQPEPDPLARFAPRAAGAPPAEQERVFLFDGIAVGREGASSH